MRFQPMISLAKTKIGSEWLEHSTYGLEIRCSVQLSYEPVNNTSTTRTITCVS